MTVDEAEQVATWLLAHTQPGAELVVLDGYHHVHAHRPAADPPEPVLTNAG